MTLCERSIINIMSNVSLTDLDAKWGWITEDADPEKLPSTLRRLESASRLAVVRKDPVIFNREIAMLHAEGAIRG